MKRTFRHYQVWLQTLRYEEQRWDMIADLRAAALLNGLQDEYTELCCWQFGLDSQSEGQPERGTARARDCQSGGLPERGTARAGDCQSGGLPERGTARAGDCQSEGLPERETARARDCHRRTNEGPLSSETSPGQKKGAHTAWGDRPKVYLFPLHNRLGLIKIYVKETDK